MHIDNKPMEKSMEIADTPQARANETKLKVRFSTDMIAAAAAAAASASRTASDKVYLCNTSASGSAVVANGITVTSSAATDTANCNNKNNTDRDTLSEATEHSTQLSAEMLRRLDSLLHWVEQQATVQCGIINVDSNNSSSSSSSSSSNSSIRICEIDFIDETVVDAAISVACEHGNDSSVLTQY